jgi:hypothetical protein
MHALPPSLHPSLNRISPRLHLHLHLHLHSSSFLHHTVGDWFSGKLLLWLWLWLGYLCTLDGVIFLLLHPVLEHLFEHSLNLVPFKGNPSDALSEAQSDAQSVLHSPWPLSHPQIFHFSASESTSTSTSTSTSPFIYTVAFKGNHSPRHSPMHSPRHSHHECLSWSARVYEFMSFS